MGWRFLPSRQLPVAAYRRHRWLMLGFACLQAFLASGIMYGWAALYSLWLHSGVYNELCSADYSGQRQPGDGDSLMDHSSTIKGDGSTSFLICELQKRRLQQIFTIAASVNLVAQLLWGWVGSVHRFRFAC